jgi:hypothetical protein
LQPRPSLSGASRRSPALLHSSPPAAGADAFGPEDRRDVAQAFADLRMDRAVAKELLAEAGRK